MHPSRCRPGLLLLAALLPHVFIASTNAQQHSDLPGLNSKDPLGPQTSTKAPQPTGNGHSKGPSNVNTGRPTGTSSYGLGSNAPTLYGAGVPPLIVPDTSGAPFMQTSSLPQGFVFIVVGAILGFLGGCVLAWRGLVAWSLHRSVRRAAAAKYASEKEKSKFGTAAPTGYSSLFQSANVSSEHLPFANHPYKPGTGQRLSKTTKPSRHSTQPSNVSSLFYSPTAGVAQSNNHSRQSSYLPAGYYASGASKPATGAIASLGGPAGQGYGRVDNYSPPDTPKRHRRNSSGRSRRHSRSESRGLDDQSQRNSLHIPNDRKERRHRTTGSRSRPQSVQRAPSAMLDELFENHTGMRDRE